MVPPTRYGNKIDKAISVKYLDSGTRFAAPTGSQCSALKGVSEIVPIFETVFVLACHYAISKLCKGMLHHYGAWHVPPRLHIHRFRPWAPVPLPGVCFLTNAHGSPIAHFERFCSPAGWSCGTRA